ncbi:hypothetical protein [Actinophytocola sp.]|uniref:hypothetical protein n=1 Tax=Actinophytocola sp. TaxID=1872138 RepID=UPI003D6BEB1E
MSFQRPGAETRADRAAREITRVYGEYAKDTAGLNLGGIAERVMFDLDDAVTAGDLPNGLRFAILGRGDHLLVDVFGLTDDEVAAHTDVLEDVVGRYVAAYGYTNPEVAWDTRFTVTVRVLSEAEQFSLRNAPGAIDVRHYPY